jgi:hypothetical protein
MHNFYQRLSDYAKRLNEKFFGLPFQACGPDGKWQTLDASTIDGEGGGEELRTMQVVGNTVDVDANTGADVVSATPNITISNLCLDPFPKAGENWVFKLPETPHPDAPMIDWQMSKDRVYTEKVLGVTTIYLLKVRQKS